MNKLTLQTGILISLFAILLISGCSSHKTLTLMPTPVLYQESIIDPFAHLTLEQKSTTTQVFYATNRAPKISKGSLSYGNDLDTNIHLGKATIRLGTPDTDWHTLYKSSLSLEKSEPIPLRVDRIIQQAVIPAQLTRSYKNLTTPMQEFVDLINAELAEAIDKEIMVYVHGTKVDFSNSTILTAEIDHFAGRDFIGLAFAWPSHQNILSYMSGVDVRRALDSSPALQNLIVLLSEHTAAEHINILSYSAGGKVSSKALYELRQAFNKLDSKQLKDKFRLGSVVYAAADVEVDIFLERLPAISEMAEQVVITVSDNDNALKAAKRYMGGDYRAGTLEAEEIEEDFIVRKHLPNVEIIDVSYGKDVRGFDIIGHHYWYRHPWMSSDIIFLMRTDLPPHRRGLSEAELEGIWYLSDDYPEKIREAAAAELKGQWN
jgi:esterase/lipase superfamily enzyme